MRGGFYRKLAIDGIRKNSKLYVPYLITCILMVNIFYVMSFMAKSGIASEMAGGDSLSMILNFGTGIMALFSGIFLFYTNSFLIKRRKKEFGIYNVLGMNKRNLSRILLWETFLTWMLALVFGLGSGILISKFAEVGLRNLIKLEMTYSFSVNSDALVRTVGLFSLVFLLILLNSIRQVRFAGAMELVRSENFGEKPPKANWLVGIVGILILASGYGLCIAVKQPMAALPYFMLAVIVIIIGLYLVFMAGSVMLCRMLQKNSNYYYKLNHFVSVSSMAYRMKRNGAGLASICILLTMVLVMISSSSCLYFNANDCMNVRYPAEFNSFVCRYGYNDKNVQLADALTSTVKNAATVSGAEVKNELTHYEYSITGYLKSSKVDISVNSKTNKAFIDYNKIAKVRFLDVKDYNRMFNKKAVVKSGEAIICAFRTNDYSDVFTVGNVSFKIVGTAPSKLLDQGGLLWDSVSPTIYLIVNDVNSIAVKFGKYKDYDASPMLAWFWYSQFDTDLSSDKQPALSMRINDELKQTVAGINVSQYYCEARSGKESDFYGVFGGLFFIGIMLSIIFLTACVIMIYYKQISEGYEDKSRFEIMQKLGMSKEHIRKSINSQMRTVFLLPIIFAVMNMGFVFPVIYKMLMLFGLFNLPKLLVTAGITVLICALFYVLVYRITSNKYYRIVSTH